MDNYSYDLRERFKFCKQYNFGETISTFRFWLDGNSHGNNFTLAATDRNRLSISFNSKTGQTGGLFVLSWDFTHLILTDKWLPIIPLMQILCLQAMLGFVNTPAAILFQASGKPSIDTKISTLGLIILAILIYPLSSRWGVVGTLSSLFLGVLFTSPITWFMGMKVAKCSFSEFIKPVLFPVVNTALMAIVIFVIKKYIFIQTALIEFFGLIFIGIVTYFTLAYFLDRCFNYGIYKLVKERIAVLK